MGNSFFSRLESLPLLQINFYTSLIEGKIHEDEISKYLSDYQISFSGPFFCCLVIHTSSSRIPKDNICHHNVRLEFFYHFKSLYAVIGISHYGKA